MRPLTFTIFSFILLLASTVAAQNGAPATFRGAPVVGFDVIESYAHDETAYTQGLEIHEGVLYEGTGRYRESTLRRVDLETGNVLAQIELPEGEFGEGVTVFGGQIYQLTWRAGIGHIYKLDTMEKSGDFYYQGEGWGLTHDGTNLIMSNGGSDINYLNPETFQIERTLSVWDSQGPVRGLNELEYIDGQIWANIFPTDLIARIDPETGEVTSWIFLTGLLDEAPSKGRADVLNGIAYDHETGRLFLTGKLWPRLYEVEILE